eukprot:gene5340-5369_t
MKPVTTLLAVVVAGGQFKPADSLKFNVLAHDRPFYLRVTLESLLAARERKHFPLAVPKLRLAAPIDDHCNVSPSDVTVYIDSDDAAVLEVAGAAGVVVHQSPHAADVPSTTAISRHYRYALDHVFGDRQEPEAVFMEDDLD